jgi:bifunctional N-acetylglucosamine-1-phosphate-uridyltransferase/glucosamine-1-phosphate-acetyltransferase GlmU-like protein
MTQRPLSAVVLAAGEGTRMRSERPKPLHLLCGRAMLLYVLDSLADCTIDRAVVVVGHGAERVTKKLQEQGPDLLLDFVEQDVQRGTGDAVSVGLTNCRLRCRSSRTRRRRMPRPSTPSSKNANRSSVTNELGAVR